MNIDLYNRDWKFSSKSLQKCRKISNFCRKRKPYPKILPIIPPKIVIFDVQKIQVFLQNPVGDLQVKDFGNFPGSGHTVTVIAKIVTMVWHGE